MPSAGQTIRALDFTDTAVDVDSTDETGFTNTTFSPGGTAVGTAFVAPTSGSVLISIHARFESNSAGVAAVISFAVREGGTIGSGTSVLAASIERALQTETVRLSAGMSYVLDNLTAGSTYNAQIEFMMASAGNGDIFNRLISVVPVP